MAKLNENAWGQILNSMLNQFVGAAGTAGIGTVMSLFSPNTAVGSIGRAMTGSGLTGAQNEQNAFNASQAEITRQWQEKMQGSQYQRSVKDMLAAGLNPALMYGSSGVASMPTGATASGNAHAPDVSSLINMMMVRKNMDLIDSEIVKNKADANKSNADAEGQNITNSYLDQTIQAQLGLYTANYNEINAQIDLLKQKLKTEQAQTNLTRAGISLKNAEVALTTQKAIAERIQNDYREELLKLDVTAKDLNNGLTAANTNKNDAEIKKLTEELALVKAQVDNIQQDTILKMMNQGLISQETENAAIEWAIKNEHLSQEQVKTKYASKEARAHLIGSYVNMACSVVDSAANLVSAVKPGVSVSTTSYEYNDDGKVSSSYTTNRKN